jgi:hypothetical protein
MAAWVASLLLTGTETVNAVLCFIYYRLETHHAKPLDDTVALPLNCSGMYRGVIRPDGVPMTAIFSDEELSEL